MSVPLLYVFLGSTGSGRRDVAADLIEFGLEPDEKAVILVAETEEPNGEATAHTTPVLKWKRGEEGIEATVPPEISQVFMLVNGRENPVDQLEAIKEWIDSGAVRLGRILTVINSALYADTPGLGDWYDACIHFSDVVLLNNRTGVSEKWISSFKKRLQEQFMPCLIELVKKGKVPNPALVLYPEGRRLSLAFEEVDEMYVFEDDDEEEDEISADPYFERSPSGQRVKVIPDVRNHLKL
jgi:hypothetical protein